MIDRKAFRSLSSGLYLITARNGNGKFGCVANTLVQVASEPPTLAVSHGGHPLVGPLRRHGAG